MYKKLFKSSLTVDTALFLAALSLILGALYVLQPQFTDMQYRLEGSSRWFSINENPFYFHSHAGPESLEIEFNMKLGFIRPSYLLFIPDDCVDRVSINEKHLSEDLFPLCDYWFGRAVDISEFTTRGDNAFSLLLRNHGGQGKLKLHIAKRDPALITLWGLMLFIFGLYIWRVARFFKLKNSLWMLFGAGFLIRLYYLLITRYEFRGHDAWSHFLYIDYLVKNAFALPDSTTGWEFYHPPVYYFLSAVWVKISMLVLHVDDAIIRCLQVQSFLLTVGAFVCTVWIGMMLYAKQKEVLKRALFISIFALQPVLIFFAARINNDVTYNLFAFASLALLILWWQKAKARNWYLCIIAICLALLSKSNAMLILPIAYACLLVSRKVQWKKKTQLGGIGLLIILLMTGWFYVLRFAVENNTSIVENTKALDLGLAVDGSYEMLAEFNPIRIVKKPFNEIWTEGSGRDHFWEFWVRSIFFGEFDFGKPLRLLASSIMLIALILMPLTGIGFFYCIRHRTYDTFPLWITTVILLFGHMAFRQLAPFGPSQDFRYSVLALVPFSYFLLEAIGNCHSKHLRAFWYGLLGLLIALCAIFVVLVPMADYMH